MMLRLQTRQRAHTVRAAVIGLALACGAPVLVMAQAALQSAAPKSRIEIAAGPAGQTLKQFVVQTGVQLLFDFEAVNHLVTQPVSGELSAAEALTRMLVGTGLDFEFVNERTVTVTAHDDAKRKMPVATRTGFSSDTTQSSGQPLLRLAQTHQNGWPAGQSPEQLEEIVVTAQKREERVFDVPISIVAMSADELQKRKVIGLDDLALAVPGLAIQSGSYQRRIMMRGVSNVFGSSSLIGLYLDEASVTSAPDRQLDLRTYDLERVEVLRGPQGTLYGEGSVGGTIRFITKDPVLDRFSMYADVAAVFTEDGAPGGRIEGALNIPLIENELGLRIAGTFDHEGGWVDQPAANRKDFNDQNLANVRVKGLWQPAPQFAVNAMALIHRNDAPPGRGEDSDGNYSQTFNLTTTPAVQDDYELFNLTLSYDFPAIRLLSTTSYVQQDKEVTNLGYRPPLLQPPLPSFDVYLAPVIRGSTIFTEEARLTSTGSGPWQWTVGGFYRDADLDDDLTYLFALPIAPGTPLPAALQSQSRSTSKSWAAFGDTSYRLTGRLTLGTGLRYFHDDQDYASGATQKGEFHALNPRLYAHYALTDMINTYASAAKGFRSGGFNSVGPSYDPEEIWTYELGTKMSLLGGRLRADTALFYSDYSDYQIVGLLPAPAPPFGIVSNAGNVRIRGIEWALTWRPVEDWSLIFNGNHVNAEFTEINVAESSHAVGDSPDLFPKYSYTVSTQRDFKWKGRGGFARLDYNQQGRSSYRNRNISGPSAWYFSESAVIDMLNLNVSLQWNEALLLGLFAQNLLNDRGFTDPFSIEQGAVRSRPRIVGVEFGVKFD